MLNIIVAFCKNKGIGYKNNIPWYIPSDLKHFKYITSNTKYPDKVNAVIMGKNTWLSIGEKPLKNRINFIVSKTLNQPNHPVHVLPDFQSTINYINLNYKDTVENIFAIGGENIYSEALKHDLLDKVYITEIFNNFECDKYFPYYDENKFNKILSDEQHKNKYFFYENEVIYTNYILIKK